MHNKKITLALSFLTLATVGFWIWFLIIRADQIVYVDAARILHDYKGAKKAHEAFQEKSTQWQHNIDTLGKELQQTIFDFESKEATLDKAARESARRELTEKQKQFDRYQQTIRQNAQQEDMKITGEVVNEINRFLKTYGKKHRYKYILIANQAGTIAYAADGLDITDEVITALNTHYETDK